jgi:hypothetical protein
MKKVNNRWQCIINWGERRLPRIFFRRIDIDGITMRWSRWITHQDYNAAMKRADDWYRNLKWE